MKRTLSLGLALAIATAVAAPAVWAKAGDKPRIAVLEFKNKAENQWWYSHGGTAAQDVFVTELVKSGKFRVIEREQLEALMQEKGSVAFRRRRSEDRDPSRQAARRQLLPDRRAHRIRHRGQQRQHARIPRSAGRLGEQEEVHRRVQRAPDRR